MASFRFTRAVLICNQRTVKLFLGTVIIGGSGANYSFYWIALFRLAYIKVNCEKFEVLIVKRMYYNITYYYTQSKIYYMNIVNLTFLMSPNIRKKSSKYS